MRRLKRSTCPHAISLRTQQHPLGFLTGAAFGLCDAYSFTFSKAKGPCFWAMYASFRAPSARTSPGLMSNACSRDSRAARRNLPARNFPKAILKEELAVPLHG